MSAGHEVDGPLCRLAAWEREVARRGWVRVIGRVASYLYDRGLVQYGPFWLTAEQEMRDANLLQAEGVRDANLPQAEGVRDPRISSTPKRTNSAFVPRWAYEVARAFGTFNADGSGTKPVQPKRGVVNVNALEFVRGDENLQRAVEAAAMLAENASDARKAVAAVVRSAMQETKGECRQ